MFRLGSPSQMLAARDADTDCNMREPLSTVDPAEYGISHCERCREAATNIFLDYDRQSEVSGPIPRGLLDRRANQKRAIFVELHLLSRSFLLQH